MKKTRRTNNQSNRKYAGKEKQIQKSIKNDYCQQKKSHRFSHLCKSIFLKK
jgi:hypothetical protein